MARTGAERASTVCLSLGLVLGHEGQVYVMAGEGTSTESRDKYVFLLLVFVQRTGTVNFMDG